MASPTPPQNTHTHTHTHTHLFISHQWHAKLRTEGKASFGICLLSPLHAHLHSLQPLLIYFKLQPNHAACDLQSYFAYIILSAFKPPRKISIALVNPTLRCYLFTRLSHFTSWDLIALSSRMTLLFCGVLICFTTSPPHLNQSLLV
jgi:hypothetical protein